MGKGIIGPRTPESNSRALLNVMVEFLELIASDNVPDADVRDVLWACGLLLTSSHKPPVGVNVDALNVIVVAEEESLRRLLLVKKLLVHDDTNSTGVVHNL